jgi:tyrosyl-tRNA synthetase
MWRYYLLLTDLGEAQVAEERERGRPMESKLALARRIVADFHGAASASAAETEWRRVHQAREAPAEMPEHRLAPGRHRWRDALVAAGLASSKSEAERLLRQGAVRRDGQRVEPGAELELQADQSIVVSVGAARFVRLRVGQ